MTSQPRARAVFQLDRATGTVVARHATVAAGARAAGTHSSAIALCCRGILKQTGGFRWAYCEPLAPPRPIETPVHPPEPWLHWLGGFLDGDGSASIAKKLCTPVIGFQQAESGKRLLEDIRDTLAAAFPQFPPYCVGLVSGETDTRQPKWSLQYGAAMAVRIAGLLAPYAIVKSRQLRIIARLPMAQPSLRLSAEGTARRREAYDTVKQMNASAPPESVSWADVTDPYLAGFFDAEGTVDMWGTRLQLAVTQKHPHILRALAAAYGGYLMDETHRVQRHALQWAGQDAVRVGRILRRECRYKDSQLDVVATPGLAPEDVAARLYRLKGSKRPVGALRPARTKADGLPGGVTKLVKHGKHVGYRGRWKFGGREFWCSRDPSRLPDLLRQATAFVDAQKARYTAAVA